MAASANLKVHIGADTSQFTKGMKDAKTEINAFAQASESGLGKLGELFGINTSKVAQLSDAVRGMGRTMEASGEAGAASLGKVVTAAGGVAVALGAIGVAAVTAAFRELSDEAENFKMQVQGANIELQTAAYLDTYRQVLHDYNGDMGKAIAETEAGWKEAFGSMKGFIHQFFTSGTWLKPEEGAAALETQIAAANAQGEKAKAIAKEIYDIDRQSSAQRVAAMQIDAKIAEKRKEGMDATLSSAEQLAAISDAETLIKLKYEGITSSTQEWAEALGTISVDVDGTQKKYEGLNTLAERRAQLEADMVNLASSTTEAYDKQYVLQAKAAEQIRRENEELKMLSRRRNTLIAAVEKENALKAEGAKLESSKVDLQSTMDALKVPFEIDQPSIASIQKACDDTGVTITATVEPEVDLSGMADLSGAISGMLADSIMAISDLFGTLIGDLITTSNDEAWSNFGDNALAALGKLATKVGGIAIATGVALLAIQTGLETFDPWVMMAAGAALVALGAAVTAALSNAATGSTASTVTNTAVASSSASSSYNDYDTAEVVVRVEGTLEAEGSRLVSVINTVNNKRQHTT